MAAVADLPGPVTPIIGMNQLECTDAWSVDVDGSDEPCFRLRQLHDLQGRPADQRDLLTRYEGNAGMDYVRGDVIQQLMGAPN